MSEGAEVIAIQEFIPDSDTGMVEVPIEFDPVTLKEGERVVVVENIYDKSTAEEIEAGVQTEDIHILAHEDLDNMEQSLHVTTVPQITEAPVPVITPQITETPQITVMPPLLDTPGKDTPDTDIPKLGEVPENELLICLGVSLIVVGVVSLVIATEIKRNRIYKN